MTTKTNYIDEVYEQWKKERSHPLHNPIRILNKLIKIIKPDMEKFFDYNAYNFSTEIPPEEDDDIDIHKIFKMKKTFIKKLIKDYLSVTYRPSLKIRPWEVHALNTTACHLACVIHPVIITHLKKYKNIDLIERLFIWAQEGTDAIAYYAIALLSAIMKDDEFAREFIPYNNKLIPLVLKKVCELYEIHVYTANGQTDKSQGDNTHVKGIDLMEQQNYMLCYLTTIKDSAIFEDLCVLHSISNEFFKIVSSIQDDDHEETIRRTTSLISTVSLYVCTREFSIKFINANRLEKLLRIPRMKITHNIMVKWLHQLSSHQEVMELICQQNAEIISKLTFYAVLLLKDIGSDKLQAIQSFEYFFTYPKIVYKFNEFYKLTIFRDVLHFYQDCKGIHNDEPTCGKCKLLESCLNALTNYAVINLNFVQLKPHKADDSELDKKNSEFELLPYQQYNSNDNEAIQAKIESLQRMSKTDDTMLTNQFFADELCSCHQNVIHLLFDIMDDRSRITSQMAYNCLKIINISSVSEKIPLFIANTVQYSAIDRLYNYGVCCNKILGTINTCLWTLIYYDNSHDNSQKLNNFLEWLKDCACVYDIWKYICSSEDENLRLVAFQMLVAALSNETLRKILLILERNRNYIIRHIDDLTPATLNIGESLLPTYVTKLRNILTDMDASDESYSMVIERFSDYKPIETIISHGEEYLSVEFSFDGQYLLTGTQYGKLSKFPGDTSSSLFDSDIIGNLQINKNNLLLVSTADDSKTSVIWNVTKFEDTQYQFDDHNHVEFSKLDGKLVVSTNYKAWIQDLQTSKIIQKFIPTEIRPLLNYEATTNMFDTLVLHDNILWDIQTGKKIHTFFRYNKSRGIFHSSRDDVLFNHYIWDLRTFRLREVVPYLQGMDKIMFSRLNSTIYAVEFGAGKVLVINPSDYALINEITSVHSILSVACNTLDTRIAVAYQNSLGILIYDAEKIKKK